MNEVPKDVWVCPNDRQLALRAKLRTGWSVKTNSFSKYTKQDSLNDVEQETIVQVIKRAEQIDNMEQERVGRLVEKLENMKKNAMGNGQSQCILCGDQFGLLRASSLPCNDCRKAVCTKCSVDTSNTQKDQIWLCKICSETRETWKKSGAWFFKGLPKYILPGQKRGVSKYGSNMKNEDTNASTKPRNFTTWTRRGNLRDGSEHESEESSDDDPASRMNRLQHKGVSRITVGEQQHVGADIDSHSCPGYRTGVPTPTSLSLPSQRQQHASSPNIPELFQNGKYSSAIAPQYLTPDGNENKQHQRLVRSNSDRTEAAASRRKTKTSTTDDNKDDNGRRGSIKSASGSLNSSHSGSRTDLHHSYNNSKLSNQEPSKIVHDSRPSSRSHSRKGSQHSIGTVDTMPITEGLHPTSRNSSTSNIAVAVEGAQAECYPTNADEISNQPEEHVVPTVVQAHKIENADPQPTSTQDQTPHLGSLDFSLLFDPIDNALHCKIHRAQNLRPMDSTGLSDPYVRLHLLPGSSNAHKLRTKTVHKTLNPEFNETLTYFGITEGDIIRRSLRLTVLDDDIFGHDFIGEAIISLRRLRPHQTKHISVYLDKMFKPNPEEDVVSDHSDSGKILLGLMYNTHSKCLNITIIRCRQLPSKDANGFSDPFVRIQLRPDPSRRRYKTAIKWKNLNPEFNEEFYYEAHLQDLTKRVLILTVWDKDYGKTDDYIGGLQLGLRSKGARLWHWLETINNPDRRIERWHNLSSDYVPE
ncbi:DOC2B (predicted) [Pycnogonum litorale]